MSRYFNENGTNSFNQNRIPQNIEHVLLNKEKENRYVTSMLVVDSRERNKDIYPEPNQYVYELIEGYKNIVEVELVSAYIYGSDYTINKKNNILSVKLVRHGGNIIPSLPIGAYLSPKTKDLCIPLGNYSQEDLADKFGAGPPVTNIWKNMDEKINDVFNRWKGFENSPAMPDDVPLSNDICCKFNYNESKYYFFDKTEQPKTFSNIDGPAPPYILGHLIELDFHKNNRTIYDSYSINELDRSKNPPVKINKRVILDYPDYAPNSIGKYLGFKPKVYSNKFLVKVFYKQADFPNNDPGVLTIHFNDVLTFNKFYNICILQDPDFHVYLDNIDTPNDYYLMRFDGSKHIQVYELDEDNLKIVLCTYRLVRGVVPPAGADPELPTGGPYNMNLYMPIVSDNIYCLEYDPYILLDIPQFMRYDSRDKATQNSFVKIPLSNSHKVLDLTRAYGNMKELNPPIASLNKLDISFRRPGGELYNFNGRENCLVFAITTIQNVRN